MHLEGRPQTFTDVDEGFRAIWNTELNGVGEPQPALSNAKCDLTRDNSAPGGLEVATGPYCGLTSELAPLRYSTRSPSAGSTFTPRDSRNSMPRSSSSGSPATSSRTQPWSRVTSARRMLVTISKFRPSW